MHISNKLTRHSFFLPTPPNLSIRKKLDEYTLAELHEVLPEEEHAEIKETGKRVCGECHFWKVGPENPIKPGEFLKHQCPADRPKCPSYWQCATLRRKYHSQEVDSTSQTQTRITARLQQLQKELQTASKDRRTSLCQILVPELNAELSEIAEEMAKQGCSEFEMHQAMAIRNRAFIQAARDGVTLEEAKRIHESKRKLKRKVISAQEFSNRWIADEPTPLTPTDHIVANAARMEENVVDLTQKSSKKGKEQAINDEMPQSLNDEENFDSERIESINQHFSTSSSPNSTEELGILQLASSSVSTEESDSLNKDIDAAVAEAISKHVVSVEEEERALEKELEKLQEKQHLLQKRKEHEIVEAKQQKKQRLMDHVHQSAQQTQREFSNARDKHLILKTSNLHRASTDNSGVILSFLVSSRLN